MPCEVKTPWPFLLGADAVLPPEPGDKVSAGVSDCRYPELLDKFDDIFAKAFRIRARVIWFVQTVVDASAKMLHERTEQSAVNGSNREMRIDSEACYNHGRLS